MERPEQHPLVQQLRFARSEFLHGVNGVSDEDASVRLEPMNCLAWNVGHLASQEQAYFLAFAQGREPLPDITRAYRSGAPGTAPLLSDTLAAWSTITAAADPWLDTVTTAVLLEHPVRSGKPMSATFGNLLLRATYHYWYHCGENQAIRQQLGHTGLRQFVGNIDGEAPYRPEPR